MSGPLGLISTPIASDRDGNRVVLRSTNSVIVGTAVETDTPVRIGFEERCGGLYILGQPRTGKSNLLVGLALSDIRRNHGILFIDPHTDAINDLLGRIPENRRDNVILLDPTDREYSFGINLLHCRDPKNGIELDNACGRVRDVFVKVWGDDRGQLGVWLNKIIKNAVYLLLENPGYTLYDLPPLLWEDAMFRNELLKNVKVKTGVKDFWYNEFDRLTKRDRTEQVEPALSRLDIFRNNTMLRDIVSQVKSTIDFGQLMRERKIVLLRLPTNLASDVKHLIGTIVLSEVLYAAFEREKLPKSQREYFGIFCDEFQEFATPDFARLFTQSGKYKVMPVVAHQTRLGQFKPGDPNQGATLTSPNKVLFTLSSHDARELALEFAEAPPTETKFEEQYAISQNPVADLLSRGHTDPGIRAFVTKYLRALEDKRRDTKEDIERERFLRMIVLDEAAFYGVEAQEEGIIGPTHFASQMGALASRQRAIGGARMHSIKMLALHDTANLTRLTLREVNKFLTENMEGRIRAGQEAFSDFLVALIEGYSGLAEAFREVLKLYIRLSYGKPDAFRAIPLELAKKLAFVSGEAAFLIDQAKRDTVNKRTAFAEEYKRREWKSFFSHRDMMKARCRREKEVITEAIAFMIRDRKSFEARYPGSDYNVEVWVDDFLKRRWTDNSDPHYGAAQDILTDSRMWWYPPLPDRNYQNPCALDFGPESAGREPLDLLRSHRNRHYWMKEAERIREDMQTWKKLLQERWGYFSRERPQAARIWSSLDAVTRWYLLMRASDLALYDERLANITFPKPSNSDYAWVVSSLVWLFTEYKNELAKKADDEEEADERRLIEKSCAEEVGKISVAPPAQLKPRTLSAREIQVVRNTCIEELKAVDKQTRGVAATIDEFARFCELLSKPENHIKVRTGQLVERHVQTRQEADMVNEVARVLTSLPKYTAYAKIVAEKGGVPQIWKGKIKTARLVAAREDEAAETRRSVVKHMVDYCRPRGHIQEEIDRRQKKWGVHAPDAPLASAKRPPVPARFGAQSPQPPPTRTRGRLPRDR